MRTNTFFAVMMAAMMAMCGTSASAQRGGSGNGRGYTIDWNGASQGNRGGSVGGQGNRGGSVGGQTNRGGSDNHNRGGYDNHNQGTHNMGGYDNRNHGGYDNRNHGGYDNRNHGGYNRGYDSRNHGGYSGRTYGGSYGGRVVSGRGYTDRYYTMHGHRWSHDGWLDGYYGRVRHFPDGRWGYYRDGAWLYYDCFYEPAYYYARPVTCFHAHLLSPEGRRAVGTAVGIAAGAAIIAGVVGALAY